MNFLPKELDRIGKGFDERNQNFLSAIDILEKAQKETLEEKVKQKSFWDLINPFKCE